MQLAYSSRVPAFNVFGLVLQFEVFDEIDVVWTQSKVPSNPRTVRDTIRLGFFDLKTFEMFFGRLAFAR